MAALTAYKITCANGHSWSTSMAAHVTREMAENYFLGAYFNTASFPDEVMSEAVSVEQIRGPQVRTMPRQL